jgi:hypothetical protein
MVILLHKMSFICNQALSDSFAALFGYQFDACQYQELMA